MEILTSCLNPHASSIMSLALHVFSTSDSVLNSWTMLSWARSRVAPEAAVPVDGPNYFERAFFVIYDSPLNNSISRSLYTLGAKATSF